jgi:hypothetical protein
MSLILRSTTTVPDIYFTPYLPHPLCRHGSRSRRWPDVGEHTAVVGFLYLSFCHSFPTCEYLSVPYGLRSGAVPLERLQCLIMLTDPCPLLGVIRRALVGVTYPTILLRPLATPLPPADTAASALVDASVRAATWATVAAADTALARAAGRQMSAGITVLATGPGREFV